jgi:TatD DNase family protein
MQKGDGQMSFVDIHAHLTDAQFVHDLPQVIERAKAAGVKAIICNGVNPINNREVLEIAKTYDIVKAALGAYPTDALGFEDTATGLVELKNPWDLDAELEFMRQQKDHIIAIGEVGLEFKHITDPVLRRKQIANLLKIFSLAEVIKKPVILHTRGAEAELLELLQSTTLKKADLHSFGGRKLLVRKANEMGLHLSVPPVCVRLDHYKMVVDEMNINQLLTETDSPWLCNVAGERNEPKNVVESVKFIAKQKKFDLTETANALFFNYQRLFL